MQRSVLFAAATVAFAGSVLCQNNVVAGLDGKLSDIGDPRYWGRQGAAFPGGQIGFSVRNTMCNPGTVSIPWQAAMSENHPKFGFMVVRLNGDRLVQISDRSFCKHAFTSLNSNNGACLPCTAPNSSGVVMAVGCSDVYANSNNGDRFWLGPADEIDPWTGTWNHTGSYFDRGDPEVAPTANTDGLRSLTTAQTSAFNAVKNRVTMNETDLQGIPGALYYYQIHLIHQGESVANRNDNLMTRGVTFNWTGTTWTVGNGAAVLQGGVLNRWTGATVGAPTSNGNDDGRFQVAVKVTGPTNGLYHYEYAVHNIDNKRGAAALHIPACTAARVQNFGFRDIDGNALNQWTPTFAGGEIMFNGPAGNPLLWNMLFNFWFDSDAAPVAGNITFDEANIGPGALQVAVATQVPGNVPNVWLGDGCGTPTVTLSANGIATIPNPAFSLNVNTAPVTGVLTFFSLASANLPIAAGCNQYLGGTNVALMSFVLTDLTGNATLPLPIGGALAPATIYLQSAALVNGGPVFGSLALSNGLGVRIGLTGCP